MSKLSICPKDETQADLDMINSLRRGSRRRTVSTRWDYRPVRMTPPSAYVRPGWGSLFANAS